MLPSTVAGFSQGGGSEGERLRAIVAALAPGQPLWFAVYVALVVFSAFFYASIVMNPQETADNLSKYAGFLPGIRPGAKTAEYINYVLTRITVVGAIFLSMAGVLPDLLFSSGIVQFHFSGAALLIVVVGMLELFARSRPS